MTLLPVVLMTFAHSTLNGQNIKDSLILKRSLETCPVRKPVSDTVTLVFLGDIMLHLSQIQNTRQADGTHCFDDYFKGIEKEIKAADICVANMEFTLGGEPYSGYPVFSAPDSYAEYMAECGIDVFLTANNHILDKGDNGLKRTLDQYRKLSRKHDIRYTGSTDKQGFNREAGPLMIYAKGLRIAFVNFTYGTNLAGDKSKCFGPLRMDSAHVRQAITDAENLDADYIIALPHWGEEYSLKHSPAQRKVAEELISHGVDAIVGTHPHVIQDFEKIGKVPVVYSLGNAISNMSAPNTQTELMFTLRIAGSPDGNVEVVSTKFTYLWCSLPGRLKKSHCTVKIADMLGRKSEWLQKYEYDKMVSTYLRVQKATGIKDSQ